MEEPIPKQNETETQEPEPVVNEKFAELEALLFYYGEPMEVARIAKFLGMKPAAGEALIAAWSAALAADPLRGLEAFRSGDAVQLVTKPTLKAVGEKLVKEEFREELTPAGLETLSLIAYLGPISRPRIDYIRGVNSSFTVRNLLMRGLLEREHGSDKGHLYEYRVSMQFLKHLGVPSTGALPDYASYHALLGDFEAQRTESSRLEEQPTPEVPPVVPGL